MGHSVQTGKGSSCAIHTTSLSDGQGFTLPSGHFIIREAVLNFFSVRLLIKDNESASYQASRSRVRCASQRPRFRPRDTDCV